MKARLSNPALAAILIGGLLAGTLDIIYAFVSAALNGRPPLRVLQAVASGLLGAGAFKGGPSAGAVGLLCHFVIALGAASLYVGASAFLTTLRNRPLLWGALFGVAVYLFMNFVVLPLSRVPFKIRYDASVLLQGFVSHAFLVGIPIALAASRRLSRRPPDPT